MKFLLILILFTFCEKTNYQIENSFSTKEEILQKAFESIAKQDSKTMDKLILNRKEHNEMFWNHIGERFTKDTNMTADLAYDQMSFETRVAWTEILKKFKGRNLKFEKVVCNSQKESYEPFQLVRGCISYLTDIDTGEKIESSVIRTFIEYKGKFKIYHLKRD